jgi:hypothetical protein
MPPLIRILLVDTNGIDPQGSLEIGLPKEPKSKLAILRDPETRIVTSDLAR